MYGIDGLDTWLTQSDDRDDEMWCEICGCLSSQCAQPEREEVVGDRLETGEEIIYPVESHESHWVTLDAHERDEAADYAYEMWADKER